MASAPGPFVRGVAAVLAERARRAGGPLCPWPPADASPQPVAEGRGAPGARPALRPGWADRAHPAGRTAGPGTAAGRAPEREGGTTTTDVPRTPEGLPCHRVPPLPPRHPGGRARAPAAARARRAVRVRRRGGRRPGAPVRGTAPPGAASRCAPASAAARSRTAPAAARRDGTWSSPTRPPSRAATSTPSSCSPTGPARCGPTRSGWSSPTRPRPAGGGPVPLEETDAREVVGVLDGGPAAVGGGFTVPAGVDRPRARPARVRRRARPRRDHRARRDRAAQ